MRAIRFAVFLLAFVSGAAVAHAHAYLDHASLLAGGTVTASPSDVHMWFTQALEPKFMAAQLCSASGRSSPAATSTLPTRSRS